MSFEYLRKAMIISVTIVAVVMSAMCIQPELKSVRISGQDYLFATNLYEADKVNITNPELIKQLLDGGQSIRILFNGTNATENSLIAVVSYNTVANLAKYYGAAGWAKPFEAVDVNNETALAESLAKQRFSYNNPAIVLIGPGTGAKKTRVYVKEYMVFVEGTDSKQLQLAADRLVMTVLGVNLGKSSSSSNRTVIIPIK